MNNVILLSGGMDSFLSYRMFYPHYTPVFVNSGSRYAYRDIEFARRHAGSELVVQYLTPLVEDPSGHVPHRNTILLASVANHGANTIVVSAPRGELVWDQQPAYHKALRRVLPGVNIVNPLRRYTKAQAIALYLSTGGSREDLSNTRSCYSPDHLRCGQCPACVKRWVAMRYNGIDETYEQDVVLYAKELASRGTLRDAWRYGARPLYEAWWALRHAA